MSKILYSTRAREKILAGIETVYRAVSTTLGPKGGNVAIDRGHETIVVHDGLRVLENVKISDPYEKIGGDILLQAAKKQVDDCGDGSTLVTILARSLAYETNKIVAAGINAMSLRNGLEKLRDEIVEKIRRQAEQIFSMYGMKDFARFDGWIINDSEIHFSDFNTISGMEQNSFLFQQASRIGMSHGDLLKYIVKNSCKRQKINFPEEVKKSSNVKKKPVSVIFGGKTSERQVSLMSGTNVWLKLRKSDVYESKPFLLDFDNNVWELPYSLILNHTVEEIIENAKNAEKSQGRIAKLVNVVLEELKLEPAEYSEPFFVPKKTTLANFIKESKFVFIGLHGGMGEDGTIQKMLADSGVKYNGSDSEVSRLCMDKFATGEFIRNAGIEGVTIATQKVLPFTKIKNYLDSTLLWDELTRELEAKTLIVKPKDDGCSTGIAHLYTHVDLGEYMKHMVRCDSHIPAGTLKNQENILEMPGSILRDVLFEKFVETDNVQVKGNQLKYKRVSGMVEVTIGILEKGLPAGKAGKKLTH